MTEIPFDDTLALPIKQAQILIHIAAERTRQEELKKEGRFPFTAADPSLSDVERLPMFIEEVGEISRAVQEMPESGLQPVSFAGKFDQRRAETGNPEATRHGNRKPIDIRRGTVENLRRELVQAAAIAVAWIEAIDSRHGSTATLPRPESAETPVSAA